MSGIGMKFDAQASIRYPSDWDVVIKQSPEEKAAWIREAVRRRLIEENLIGCDEPNYSHEMMNSSKNTSNTLHPSKNTNVFKSLFGFFTKTQVQKKLEIAAQAFSAHQSQGSMK